MARSAGENSMDALSDGGGSVSITRINGVTLAGSQRESLGETEAVPYLHSSLIV